MIKCRKTLNLAERIIDGSNQQEEAAAYFPGDTLFTPFERSRGLPIGNQTSQFFANVYLNPLDQFVLRELRPARYLRYFEGSQDELQGLMLEGLASRELSEEEFWNSVDSQTTAMLAAHKSGFRA